MRGDDVPHLLRATAVREPAVLRRPDRLQSPGAPAPRHEPASLWALEAPRPAAPALGEREKAVSVTPTSACVTASCRCCGAELCGHRADARFCSNACKQRAYRERRKPEPSY